MMFGIRISSILISASFATLVFFSSSALESSGNSKVLKGCVIVAKSVNGVSIVKIQTENNGTLTVPEKSVDEFVKLDGKDIRVECAVVDGKFVPLRVMPPPERKEKKRVTKYSAPRQEPDKLREKTEA